MATFVNGDNTTTRNLHGIVGTSSGFSTEIFQDMYRFQILYNQILYILEISLTQYSEGNFTTLQDLLNEETFLKLGQLLTSDSLFDNENVSNLVDFVHDNLLFTKFRSVTNKILDGLKQSIVQYQANVTLENENTRLAQYENILQDKEKLLEYLNSVQTENYLFSAEAAFASEIILKPWYEVYLNRYGPPGDGVFKTELLADIIEELLAAGTITYADLNLSEDELTST